MENSNQKNKLMAVLSYIGILVIIPYLTSKDNPFVKFHIKQGLVLFVIEIAMWFLGMVFQPLWMLISLVNLAVLVLAIIGIVNAAQGLEKELPFVGSYSRYFKF